MRKHAIIIGAGVAGLATAVALRRIGWTVAVYERASELANGGTALGMWPEAMRALDHLGVGGYVRDQAAYSRGARILDPAGSMIGQIPESRCAHLISRGRLLATLLDQLPATDIHWAQPLKLADVAHESDVVVGADGIHSVVRARCWSSAAEHALGTVALRGVVDAEVSSVSETWGRGALFGITPTDDGRTNWFACLRSDRLGVADAATPRAVQNMFGSWHGGVADVLSRLEGTAIDRRELFDVSLPHPYVRGNVAVVGDAAHAMAPNLGRGACESLVDAAVLARALEAAPDVAEGLRRYNRLRRPRTRRIVKTARTLNRIATAERGTRVRNEMIRLLASSR
ncbi:2-polyprenyl-6-methoxyphenol hydroxylase-like FAD-dependent oxidoreductase [Microbacterium trichothecenolyticum]|uniref:FAD-dependent oxidoreductase n=1 Tax=Microbacterium trichothecenolyticum TaxID=69370 RepID=UPI00285EE729|nr:FAD-dependent oxidoreductase [Microbacterium trichothecenolyticum]MDR7187174.1 2-polyprenyl-6-methoxyphenol hydroxylase-like FAD-dependent oxidoreductase [Microbacterium trichothecenolyticum]